MTPKIGNADPVSAAEIKALFADLVPLPCLILAISGGPDSTALLLLAARWRASLKTGPKLVAVTVDHGLRPESAREAKAVGRLARKLKVPHLTLHWTGRKPKSGLQAAARHARYRLLAKAAAEAGARHILTAHTRDDQAETLLIRLTRGSGLAGLAGMARISPLPLKNSVIPGRPKGPGPESINTDWEYGFRDRRFAAPRNDHGWVGDTNNRLLLVRPLLDLPKARLLATLRSARVEFADDASNRDPRFTRVRIRALMSALEREGLSAARLSVLARRLARANAAIEHATAAAYEALLAKKPADDRAALAFDAAAFRRLPEEVALRLLGRAIAERGNEGIAELAKLETLCAAVYAAPAAPVRRTLAGALVTLKGNILLVERAPPRRTGQKLPLTKRKGGGIKLRPKSPIRGPAR
jgi:tRNA(Ile)-lysidine synthase